MGMGGAVVLFAIGAILKFATDAKVSGLDLQKIGVILMAVGAIWFVAMVAVYFGRRRTTVVRDRQVASTAPGTRTYREPGYDPDYREGEYRDTAYRRRSARNTYEERTRYDEPL